MSKELFTPKFLTIAVMILLAALSRIIPHPPNFAPIVAMALFGGAYFSNKKLAFVIPIFAMFISDLIIGLHSGMLIIYLTFIGIVAIGFLLRDNKKFGRVAGLTIGSSVIFFVTTNFAVWMSDLMYPKTIEGLIACYVAAIPFFGNSLAGDLFYSGVLFGGYALLRSNVPALQKVKI